jgi:aminopeptidase N
VEAAGEATGQDVEWLFDEYVYKPGYPEFEVSWDYSAENRLLHLSVKQNQKVEGRPAPFRLPVEIEALGEHLSQTFRMQVSGESQEFYFGLNERPVTVLFDPRDIILKSVKFHKTAAEWIWQLEHAARALNREEAAYQMGAYGSSEAVAALEKAGTSDVFYGVRVEAAQALGRIHSEAAKASLLKMLGDPTAEVRGAAAGALGGVTKSSDLVDRMLKVARTDSSFAVRRNALLSVARLKPEHGLDLLKPFLTMDAPHAEMRFAVAAALPGLSDEGAVATLLELSRDGDDRVRQTALRGFLSLGKGNHEVTDRLIEALDDGSASGDRQAALMTLRVRGDAAALPALDRIAASDALPNMARTAQSAAEAIRHPATGPRQQSTGDDLTALRARLTELEKENAELKARIERLEKK